MALIVIVVQDCDEDVDIKAMFEPTLPVDHMEDDASPAQGVAARMMLEAAKLGEVTDAS